MKYLLAAISILILVLVIAGGAFYLGQKNANQEKGMTISPTPTIFKTTTSVGTTSTPTPTIKSIKIDSTISAGGVLSFSSYYLNLPEGWVSSREQGQDMDRLTLTKGQYKIVLYQAAFGGGGCVYPGDPPAQFAQSFSSFVEIKNPNGFTLRRSPTQQGASTFTVCQKNTSDGSFGSPTSFGAISITGPSPLDDTTMAEVDFILASLNKQI